MEVACSVGGWLAPSSAGWPTRSWPTDSYGTQADLIIGAVGGLVGGLLFPQLGFLLGGGLLGHIVNARGRRGDRHLCQPLRQEIATRQQPPVAHAGCRHCPPQR